MLSVKNIAVLLSFLNNIFEFLTISNIIPTFFDNYRTLLERFDCTFNNLWRTCCKSIIILTRTVS